MKTGTDRIESALLWERGPANPVLAKGAVHVWRARLDPTLDGLCEALSRDERARAEAIVGVRTRRRWKRAHGFMRAALALYLQRGPSALLFELEEDGKPHLSSASAARLQFSLSHSGDRALLALSSSHRVGVDIELDRREIDELAIAQRAFGSEQATRLEALAPGARRRELLRAWTRREARLKLGKRPDLLDPRPWVIDLHTGEADAAALALAATPDALLCWEWP